MIDDSRTDGHVGRHGDAVVNGPEDDDLDWCSIDWAAVEGDVRRLRQRIFTASRERYFCVPLIRRACLSPVR